MIPEFEFEKTHLDSTFSESIDFAFMNCETNPATGRAFFNEVVFYHKLSKTLIVADAFWNYPEGPLPNFHGAEITGPLYECSNVPPSESSDIEVKVPLGTKLWKLGMDKVYLPFYKNFMIRGKVDEYQAVVNKILNWDVETIG